MNRTPLLTMAALAIAGSLAFAQPPTPPAPAATQGATPQAPIERRQSDGTGGMHRGMPQGRGDMMREDGYHHTMSHGRGSFHGPQEGGMMGAGFHIAPPGMWWRNPSIVQKLTLTPEQTRKMDDIFQQSRIQLIDLHANVEKQNVLLEPMLSANPPDTAKTLAQIDKVAQARADLEKADARMLLGIRGVLTPDQWTRLRTGGPGGFGSDGGPGSHGPGGPGGGGYGRGRGPGGEFVAPPELDQ